MPANSRLAAPHSGLQLTDEIKLSVSLILRYVNRMGVDQRTLLEARTVLWECSVELANHLDDEACKSREFHRDFRFLKHGLAHENLAFREMWSYVLDFIKVSKLKGDELEKMLSNIVTVAEAMLQKSPEGKALLAELIGLENKAYKGKANAALNLFFEKWENCTTERVD